MSRAVGLIVSLALVTLLGGCTGERPSLGAARIGGTTPTTTTTPTSTTSLTATTATTATTSPTSSTTTTRADPSSTSVAVPATSVPVDISPPRETEALDPDDLLGYIATPSGPPEVRVGPGDDADSIEVDARTGAGAPTTFAVVGDPTTSTEAWIQVLLPTRPNGATAYVARSSVEVTKTPMAIYVDLAARTLRVEDGGDEVFTTTTAIGTDENPTPVGVSYVTELIDNIESDGAYGPYAFGLALHSDTLSEFGGGDGQVGIHGTNRPDLIGQAVSHGCVRLTNAGVETLVDLQLPLGVPVFIT